MASHKRLIRRFITEVLNKGNLSAADDLLAADFVLHHPASSEGVRGPDSQKALITKFRTAFPDFYVTIVDVIAEGAKVAVRFTSRGTQQGDFMGHSPSGRHAVWTGIEIYRVTRGRITERWVNVDMLGLLRQLGLVTQ